jgi:hypothetical protein
MFSCPKATKVLGHSGRVALGSAHLAMQNNPICTACEPLVLHITKADKNPLFLNSAFVLIALGLCPATYNRLSLERQKPSRCELYMPNSSHPIITSWSVDFNGSVYPGGLISDNDTCGEELPPAPPTLGTGSSGGSGGGTGSGGSNGGGPHDGGWEDYPWPQGPIIGTGGGGVYPTDHPTTTPEPTDPTPPGPKDDEPVA